MPLVNSSGSSSLTSSSRNDEVTNTNEVVQTPLANQPYVTDSIINKSALSTNNYDGVVKVLLGYITGSPIVVTYFHHNNLANTQQSAPVDFSPTVDPTHIHFTRIDKFEFKVPEGFTFNFDTSINRSEWSGTGTTYSGFNPIKGDLFVYDVDGKTGLFIITNVERLTIRNYSHHRITFMLIDYVDTALADKLDECTKFYQIFEKTRFLETNGSTFEYDDYNLLREVKQLKLQLANEFISEYYNKEYKTVFHPNGHYDPYIVQCFNTLVSIKNVKYKPLQFVADLPDWKHCVLYGFAEDYGIQSFYAYMEKFIVEYSFRSSRINGLINKECLVLKETSDENVYYIFSPYFYNSDSENMSSFEKMCYLYITERTLDHADFISYVRTYKNWLPENRFYYIPICLELLNRIEYDLVHRS